MKSIFTQHAFIKKISLALLAGIGLSTAANAQYTSYFTNQIFSTNTTTDGTFIGNAFTITSGGATVTAYSSTAPGSLPAGAGFPTTGPTAIIFKNTGATKTSTITFTNTITPADHIYIQDIDNSESVTFVFKDSLGNTINPIGFTAHEISAGFPSSYIISATSSSIVINSGSAGTSELLSEVIPNARVKTIQMTYPTTAGGFEIFFGRNRPILTQSLSAANIPIGGTATLTYTLSGINNNPVYGLGFTNNLPAGWMVATPPAIVNGTTGTVTATAGSNTVSLSGMNNTFTTGTPLTTAAFSVDVTNVPGFVNPDCTGGPDSATNVAANFSADTAVVVNAVTSACLVIGSPLPVTLTSFTGSAEGCAVMLNWQTASEVDCKEYRIERSADGSSWTGMGNVPLSGNSYGAHNYSFTDKQAAKGINYYRLRIVNLAAANDFSPVVAVKLDCGVENAIRVYPNPATAFVVIDLGHAEGRIVRVYNAAGQLAASVPVTNVYTQLSIANWPAGLYQVVVRDAAGNIEKQVRLIKQ